MSKFKTAVKCVVSLSLLMTVISVFVINHEINKLWGAHTEVVDSEQFKQPLLDIAVVNVNVLSKDGEQMIPHQTVWIEQGVITKISNELDAPSGFHLIDGTGKFLIPGLIDSHVHLWQSPNDLLLYLANGVTHIRELNGSEVHLSWKADVHAGQPGPDLFVASRRHNSQGQMKGWFDRWTAKMNNVNDSDAIEANVINMIDQGYDAIKIYTFLNNSHFDVFNQIAKEKDVRLLGHIPIDMTLPEIWLSELNELAHTEELVKALDREFGGYDSDTAEAFLSFVKNRSDSIMEHLVEQNMAVVSTLALMEKFPELKSHTDRVLKTVELSYVNPGISESTYPAIRAMGWLPEVNIYRLPEGYPEARKAGNQVFWQTYAKANQIIIKAMAEAGVKVLAGTDANVPVMVPGFSLHEELYALTQSGMTLSQALRAATSAPADWMQIKSGRIQSGYQADLVLLNANPLTDIKNTQSINAVISNGRWYNREQLDAMLVAVKQANDNSRNQPISAYE